MTHEEIAAELRDLIWLASCYGCEFCRAEDEDDLGDRLRTLEHRLTLETLPSASA